MNLGGASELFVYLNDNACVNEMLTKVTANDYNFHYFM